MKTAVTLVDVRGDISEYADLIGRSGTLRLGDDRVGSFCYGGNDWLEFRRKRTLRKNGQIRVFTQLGNTFVFQTEGSDA